MQETFALAITRVLAHEGGYVNHPADPGGATNKGVTQAVYDRYRKSQGRPTRSVRQIAAQEVAAIYRGGYWDAISGDALPAGPDYATFDAAVNSGVSRASKWLQRAAGAKQDGRIGTLDTIPRVHAAADKAALVRTLCAYRLSFMQGLKIWRTFGKGWARRVAEVEVYAVKLALAAASVHGSAARTVLRNEARTAERAKAASGKGAAASAGGAAGSGGVSAVQQSDPAAASPTAALIFAAFFAVLVLVTLLLLWRRHVEKQRERAYSREAEAV